MEQHLLALTRRATAVVAPVSPLLEMGAYELLWARPQMTFARLATLFRKNPTALPSDLVDAAEAEGMAGKVLEMLSSAGVRDFGVRVHRAGEYPAKLRDASHPVELLYYQGWWNLVETPSVAVVGTRRPSEEGLRRAAKIATCLVEDGRTVVSGLAAGIDTAAHAAALKAGGATIAVIGTPLSTTYPSENAELQRTIAQRHLVVSQVPVYRYAQQQASTNRFFFPERNITMSALTDATIIVEAGETSGTLIQARAALQQGRRLFILDSCFHNPSLAWPEKFVNRGAIRVRDYDDIRAALGP